MNLPQSKLLPIFEDDKYLDWPASTIQKNTDNILTSIIGDEMVMMNINGGNYIGLNKEARVIWEQKDQPILVKKLVKKLKTRFEVP